MKKLIILLLMIIFFAISCANPIDPDDAIDYLYGYQDMNFIGLTNTPYSMPYEIQMATITFTTYDQTNGAIAKVTVDFENQTMTFTGVYGYKIEPIYNIAHE